MFKSMNVGAIKKYLQERGVTVNGYLKPALVEIASAVEKMVLPLDPNFERDNADNNIKGRLIIHDIQIEDPFSMKTKNDLIESPPFGLYDIFNHLICHATDYDKQGLAAYKSYEDYRLFENGYVRSLETVTLKDAGVHVYVGKVQPSMRSKTDDGKEYYDLWFILEGKGPNKGSVIKAFCKCKGGRDGGCKHLAAAMYSLEAELNRLGKESVTSGPCLWVAKPQSNTEPCDVKDLEVVKIKPPACKKRKRKYTWLQNIDFDPRNTKYRKVQSKEELASFTTKLSAIDPESNYPKGAAVVLPLLKKLYTPNARTDEHSKKLSIDSNIIPTQCGIMHEKLRKYLDENSQCSPENFLNTLSFTKKEIQMIDDVTVPQWQCKEWHMHKVGFLSASRCKEIYTRQTTLEKNNDSSPTLLAKSLVSSKPFCTKVIHDQPQNPMDWGLKYESSARDAYLRVQAHLHHKVELISRGFVISSIKPFMGASIDNIRSCDCVCRCDPVIVEYKCPMKHKDTDPKEAFLSPEIGGCVVGNKLQLQRKAKYFYQVQMQMYVLGLKACDFVVWTRKGIKCVEILFDPQFMIDVSGKLERFWIGQVLPLMISGPADDQKCNQSELIDKKKCNQSEPAEEKKCNQSEPVEEKRSNQSEPADEKKCNQSAEGKKNCNQSKPAGEKKRIQSEPADDKKCNQSEPAEENKCNQSELAEKKKCIQLQGNYILFLIHVRSIKNVIFNTFITPWLEVYPQVLKSMSALW